MRALPAAEEYEGRTSHGLRRGIRFVASNERGRLQAPMEAAALLCVEVAVSEGDGSGCLRDRIERAIEAALAARQAPRTEASVPATSMDACLADQLCRVRQAGAAGLLLYLPPLTPIASVSGALDAEDSAVLRWWFQAAREHPVVLLLDEANRQVGAYGPPMPIGAMVCAVTTARDDAVTSMARDRCSSLVGIDEQPAAAVAGPPVESQNPTTTPAARSGEPDADAASVVTSPPGVAPAAGPKPHGARTGHSASATPGSSSGASTAARSAPPTEDQEPEAARPSATTRRSEWRAWATDLDAARGPKPLAAIERLFVSRYVPLAEAVARGETDANAEAALEAWQASFAKSYTEAFGALRVTGKRPLMVLDAPQLGSRVARLHGARITQLLLVDGMRFDLGLRVHERLRAEVGSYARCTERFLLWAALPTNTLTQLELLARGPDALTQATLSCEHEEMAFGGRGASIPRRVRVGGRDLLKLDLVEARLRESGGETIARLDGLADEVASALVAHVKNLAPRTLLVLFGDHGFRFGAARAGTGPGTCGGATPEEVLVPAFTWLVGDVH